MYRQTHPTTLTELTLTPVCGAANIDRFSIGCTIWPFIFNIDGLCAYSSLVMVGKSGLTEKRKLLTAGSGVGGYNDRID